MLVRVGLFVAPLALLGTWAFMRLGWPEACGLIGALVWVEATMWGICDGVISIVRAAHDKGEA
jgi:hypothetical protein